MSKSTIGNNIEFFKTPYCYAVRIVVQDNRDNANHFKNKFVLGSITGESSDKVRNGWDLSFDFMEDIKKNYDLFPTINGKKTRLMPLWVSNGTFFGLARRILKGHVVENGSNFPSKLLGSIIANPDEVIYKNFQDQRWMWLQNLYSNGEIDYNFYHLHGKLHGQEPEEAYKIRAGTQGTPQSPFPQPIHSPSGNQGWNWAIGGGGIIVQNGVSVGNQAVRGSNGLFDEDNISGRTGTIIACNNPSNIKVLYLLMPFVTPSRSWQNVGDYLVRNGAGGFLDEIGHPSDGQISQAIVFDGGNSRKLWVKGEDNPLIDTYSLRQCPNFVCLWGEAPPGQS